MCLFKFLQSGKRRGSDLIQGSIVSRDISTYVTQKMNLLAHPRAWQPTLDQNLTPKPRMRAAYMTSLRDRYLQPHRLPKCKPLCPFPLTSWVALNNWGDVSQPLFFHCQLETMALLTPASTHGPIWVSVKISVTQHQKVCGMKISIIELGIAAHTTVPAVGRQRGRVRSLRLSSAS